ncbi:MAG: hypothetical protein WCT12_16550 [Verrucomicrobiota bacterium]
MIDDDKPLWDGDGEESEEAFDLKYDEWEQRDWMTWLADNLVFLFKKRRNLLRSACSAWN